MNTTKLTNTLQTKLNYYSNLTLQPIYYTTEELEIIKENIQLSLEEADQQYYNTILNYLQQRKTAYQNKQKLTEEEPYIIKQLQKEPNYYHKYPQQQLEAYNKVIAEGNPIEKILIPNQHIKTTYSNLPQSIINTIKGAQNNISIINRYNTEIEEHNTKLHNTTDKRKHSPIIRKIEEIQQLLNQQITYLQNYLNHLTNLEQLIDNTDPTYKHTNTPSHYSSTNISKPTIIEDKLRFIPHPLHQIDRNNLILYHTI